MAKNDFKMFAVNEDANVLSQEEYEALEALGTGFQSGIARSEQLNKVWRQASIMSAALADFIATQSGNDVIDDGDLVKIRASLLKALLAYSTNQLDSRYLNIVRNLSDLKDVPAARKSLGLKGAALLDVGTAAGTVAAGNDTRIVNAVPNKRKINGHPLTDDFDLTAADVKALAVTNVRAMANPSAGNVGDANELPSNATSFVYTNVPNSPSFTGSLLDFSGLGNGYNVQLVGGYGSAGERLGFRTRNGDKKTWNPWYELYHNGKEVQTTIPSNYRIAYGGYGVFWRNDGVRHYLMLTNKDNEYGNFNDLRPFYVDLATGKCQFGHDVGFSGNIYGNGVIQPGNYSNFDARYYTKSQTDAAYMAKTGAYTKGESDTRYQLKNSASLGDNGWHRDASTGLITQWMRVNRVGQYLTSFNFPMAFPSKCLAITFGEINTDNRSSQVNIWVYQYSRTGATIRMEEGETATFIIAKGY